MNENEARRISTIVSTIREDWHPSGLMRILGDQRIIGRSFEGMVRVFVELALDPKTQKPTRVFESGPWWLAAGPRGETANVPPRPRPDDCEICSKAKHPDNEDHAYEPRNSRGAGVKAPKRIHALLKSSGDGVKAGQVFQSPFADGDERVTGQGQGDRVAAHSPAPSPDTHITPTHQSPTKENP